MDLVDAGDDAVLPPHPSTPTTTIGKEPPLTPPRPDPPPPTLNVATPPSLPPRGENEEGLIDVQPGTPQSSTHNNTVVNPNGLASAWISFTILGLRGLNEPSSPLDPKKKTVPKKKFSVTDASCRVEVSRPCGPGAAPQVDDAHELAAWTSEVTASSTNVTNGIDIEFRVLAPLRFDADVADGFDRVVKLRVDGRVHSDGQQKRLTLGTATFLMSQLMREAFNDESTTVECNLAPPTTGARVVARVWSPRKDARGMVTATADANAVVIDQAFSLLRYPATSSSFGVTRRTVLEACYEPRGTHEVVRGAMQPVADAMLESASAWLRRSEAARCDAALFDNDKEATQFGARRVRLGLLGAKNLVRRPRLRSSSSSSSTSLNTNTPGTSDRAPTGTTATAGGGTTATKGEQPQSTSSKKDSKTMVGSKTLKTTFNAAAGLVKRIRDGEAPRLGVDDGGDTAPPSAFAVAEFRSSKRAFAEAVGRTNTEYATEAPAFGANARANAKCPHAKPSLQFTVSTASVETSKRRPIAKMVSPRDCGDNAGVAPIFEFYARRDESPDFQTAGKAVVKVKIYDERYSLTRGVEPVYLGECDVPLPAATLNTDERPRPQWYPLVTPPNPNDDGPGAQVLVWIHVASLDKDDATNCDESFLRAAREREHRDAVDAAAMHAWLPVAGVEVDAAAARLAAADGSAKEVADARDDVQALAGDFGDIIIDLQEPDVDPKISEESSSDHQGIEDASLRLHDSRWLEVHARALARDGERIARFASEAQDACAVRATAFKSSMRKADIEVAATPPNLHDQKFPDEQDRLWTTATSGAPTAAGPLGAQRGGLLRLEGELQELAASIRRKRVALVTASSSSPARRKAAAADLGAAARAWEARAAACGVRKALARAHALSIAVASVRAHAAKVARAQSAKAPEIAQRWLAAGLPVVFEALVSTAGAELAMLEDAAAAVKAIRGTSICFAPFHSTDLVDDDDDGSASEEDPHGVSVQRAEGNFVVQLRLPDLEIRRLGLAPTDRVRLVPVLFCQGLDVKQSLANRRAAIESSFMGSSTTEAPTVATTPSPGETQQPTSASKKRGFSLRKGKPVIPASSSSSSNDKPLDDDDAVLGDEDDQGAFGAASPKLDDDDDDDATTATGPPPPVDDSASGLQRVLNAEAFDILYTYAVSAHGDVKASKILRHLKAAVDKERAAEGKSFEKHWLILIQAELATRALDGGLCIFCKSGKDRTAMVATLAESMFFDGDLIDNDDDDDVGAAAANDERGTLPRANMLREFGTRLRICEKNTGRKKYAFNVIQRKFLPGPFQPPMAVIEDLASSVINRDTS